MKTTTKLKYYRNGLFIGFITDILSILSKYNLVALKLDAIIAVLTANLSKLNEVYVIAQKNKNTEAIELLDIRRDMAVQGIQGVVESYLKYYENNFVEAAKLLIDTIYKYDKRIDKQNYLLETETIRSLVSDFDTDLALKNALVLLHLTNWANELKNANNDFNTTYLIRNDELAALPDVNLSELRTPTIANFIDFEETIFSLNKLNPNLEYAEIMGKIEELKIKYNALVPKTPPKPAVPPVPPKK
jgi:hypothetical protein